MYHFQAYWEKREILNAQSKPKQKRREMNHKTNRTNRKQILR